MGIAILIGIIFFAGLLGGTANYYLEQGNAGSFWKSVLLGLTAAATVPLFLKTVSSSLMTDALNGDVVSNFVFFGFCTVAAIFSSKFLQSLGDKLLQEIKDVKKKQEDLSETTDVLVAQNSDPAPAPSAPGAGSSEFESFKVGEASKTPGAPALTEEQRVWSVLQSGKFAFRTLEGIASDAGMDVGNALTALSALEREGKVKQTKRVRDGVMVWSLK